MLRLAILILSGLLCINAETHAYVLGVKKYVISDPPQPSKCETVPGHWESDTSWAGPQQVCTFESDTSMNKTIIVHDYWACTSFTSSGVICLNWVFRPGYIQNPAPPQE